MARQQITTQSRTALAPLLYQAYLHYHDEAYRKAMGLLPADEIAADRMWLLYPRPPNGPKP
jgi:hypothetical protein